MRVGLCEATAVHDPADLRERGEAHVVKVKAVEGRGGGDVACVRGDRECASDWGWGVCGGVRGQGAYGGRASGRIGG